MPLQGDIYQCIRIVPMLLDMPSLRRNKFRDPQWVIACLWQSTLFVSIGPFLAYLWRRQPARAHWILLLGMATATTAPFSTGIVNHFGWGFLPNSQEITGVAQGVDEDFGSESLEDQFGFSKKTNVDGNTGETAVKNSTGLSDQTVLPSHGTQLNSSFRFWGLSWSMVLAGGWMTTSMLVAFWFICGIVIERRKLFSKGIPCANADLHESLRVAVAKLDLKTTPHLSISQLIRCPVICCWGKKPIIFIPASSVDFKGDTSIDWESIFLHELAHWKRCDHVSELLATICVIIMPWHPLIWWSRTRLSPLAESACDNWAVDIGHRSLSYAESLYTFAAQKSSLQILSAIHRQKTLENRIHDFMKNSRTNYHLGKCWSSAASITAVWLVVGIAFAQNSSSGVTDPITTSTEETNDVQFMLESAFNGARMISGELAGYKSISLSPNGKLLAAAREDLVIVDLKTGNKTSMGKGSFHNGETPIWSPKGDQIVLRAVAPDWETWNLYLADIENRKVELLMETGPSYIFPEDWSPDGKTLLCRQWKVVENQGQIRRIVTISLDSKEIKKIGANNGNRITHDPRFSPGGEFITYSIESSKPTTPLHVFGLVNRIDIAYSEYQGKIRTPRWTTDGLHIVFKGKRGEIEELLAISVQEGNFKDPHFIIKQDARGIGLDKWNQSGRLGYHKQTVWGGLFMQQIDSDTRKAAGVPKRISTGGGRVYEWSPNGRWIAQLTGYGARIIDSQSGAIHRELILPPGNSRYLFKRFAWSPDSKKIAWSESKRLQIIDINTGQEIKSFSYNEIVRFNTIRWAADGQTIITAVNETGGHFTGVYGIGIESGKLRLLSSFEQMSFEPTEFPRPVMGPENRYIVHRTSDDDENDHFYLVNLQTGLGRHFFQGQNEDEENKWINAGDHEFSQHGDLLTYVEWSGRKEEAWARLFISSIDSTLNTELADNRQNVEGQIRLPHLSPDGKTIVYSLSKWNPATNTSTKQIWAVSTTGNQPPYRLLMDESIESPSSARWSPDGKSVAFKDSKSKKEYFLTEAIKLPLGSER